GLPRGLRPGRRHRGVRGRLADGLRPGAGRDHRLTGRAHRLSLATPAHAASGTSRASRSHKPRAVSGHDHLHRPAVLSDPLVPFTDQLRLAVAAYLSRFTGSSREHTESALRCSLSWGTERGRARGGFSLITVTLRGTAARGASLIGITGHHVRLRRDAAAAGTKPLRGLSACPRRERPPTLEV